MKKVFLKGNSVSPTKSIPGVVGLTALAFLSFLDPVDAGSFTCGPGNKWVDICPSNLEQFNTAITANVDIIPNTLVIGGIEFTDLDFTTIVSGPTNIFRGEPLDAVIDNPLLGNVGMMDGNLDVIQTELSAFTLTGSTPFSPGITVIAGDGVPDLESTPSDSTFPYESLYSAGAIIERSDNPALADSFFNIFLEIQGTPAGSLRNRYPITFQGITPLTGSHPSRVDYVLTDVTGLFTAGTDGIFWTGDESEFARLIPNDSGSDMVITSTPVPEPSTGFSFVLGGLGMMFGFVRKKLSRHKGLDAC
jgi:hypothetical protein